MSHQPRTAPAVRCLFLLTACLLPIGCKGGVKGDPENRGSFALNSISTGRGSIYPYRIRELDSYGNPTTTVLNIESDATLHANASGNNGVLPVATFGTTATLPDGNPGNHYLQFNFSHALNVDSILSNLLSAQINSGMTGALSVVAYDPTTEATTTLQGRGFVNGYTYYNEFGTLRQVQAVRAATSGSGVQVLDARALGFPEFQGAADLVSRKTFTFVADTDNDLMTLETFPTGVLIRLMVSNAVRDSDSDPLDQEVATATTVGDDPNPPQVLGHTAMPEISPGNGAAGVDPSTSILVRFNKPVQPREVGLFFDATNFNPPVGGLTLSVTAAAQTFQILYYADPLSFGNFCDYRITPAYTMPGNSTVQVIAQDTAIHGLGGPQLGTTVTTAFTTGSGPGITNAPVAPEVIYLGIGGAEPGLAAIDLNGFGQGTGDLTTSRFPLNPNIGRVGVIPSLAPGTSNVDAGSSGALTLVRDSSLEWRLVRAPIVGSVTDIHIGAPLDLVFNDENVNVNTTRANQVNPTTNVPMPGNCIAVAPHPNPPRLVFPPPNPARQIFGEEPTTAGGQNLLVAGNPFTNRIGEIGIFGTTQNGVFNGPAPAPASPPPPVRFNPFNVRQQVGHFLYVLDADNRRIVVLNSNRMTVIDTIAMTDPVDMAMSPSLRRLAVANQASGSVSFIDIDPLSSSFHQVVAVTTCGGPPTSVAWQPDGEDVLAVCTATNTMAVISARDYRVRRIVAGFLNAPVDIAVTTRFTTTGFTQGVYYAYILNGNGSIAIFESGPDGVNGIGFDDVIGVVPNVSFPRARTLRYDYGSSSGSILVGHVDDRGIGQVSRLDLTSSPNGPLALNANSGGFILPPTFRQKEWGATQRFGGVLSTTPVHDLLAGNTVADICVDDLWNLGGALGQTTPYNVGLFTPSFGHSGKDAIKGGGQAVNARFLFVAVADAGRVDVLELGTGRKVASIEVPGVQVVAGYWRQ